MKIEWKTCIKIAASIFALYLAITYWEKAAGFFGLLISASAPLFIGGIVAYIVNLLMNFYEKKLFSKPKNKTAIKI